MENTIAVAVSGGMDSLYAMIRTQEAGHRVMALHARMLPPELERPGYEAMLERLAKACAAFSVPLHIVNVREAFAAEVINPFVRAYAEGKTPNPCARCNAAVKFGLLLREAEKLGASRIATGHYARLETRERADCSQDERCQQYQGGETALLAGTDPRKDQSYFLSLVPLENLSKAVTPLAEMKKEEIRAYLAKRGINVPAPAESQEICFVPDDDYRAFLLARAEKTGVTLPGPGTVTLADGTKIGNHKGLWHYTEGQRKGLGIAWKEPLYVLRKDMETNTLVADCASVAAEHAGGVVAAGNCNFLVPFERWPQTVLIRTRFRQTERPASASFDGTTLTLTEEKPNGPYTKGQIATVYAREESGILRVLGGGVIR